MLKSATFDLRGLKSNGTKSTASLYAQLIFTEIALFCMFLTKIRGVSSTELKKVGDVFFLTLIILLSLFPSIYIKNNELMDIFKSK